MENNKYYTPTIEEFHVGLVFEYKHPFSSGSENAFQEHDWSNKLAILSINNKDVSIGGYTIKPENIRVKYLDQEDIESLGWVGKDNYYTHSNGKFKLIIETYNDYKTILIETLAGFKYYNYLESIKNKSELKKLMKQLGINE